MRVCHLDYRFTNFRMVKYNYYMEKWLPGIKIAGN